MGSFAGHALPGSIFLILSFWWCLNVLKIYRNTLGVGALSTGLVPVRFKSSTWFVVPCGRLRKIPCEPIIKILLTILGIALELFPENAWMLLEENGQFREKSLNNYAHSAMFAFFLFSGLLEILQFCNALALPRGVEHLAFAVALFVEGLLFFFHLDGRPVLDKRLHILLYTVIFATSLVLLLEAWMKNSFLLLIARVYLVMLQGTWFFQIAHSLYGVNPWKDTAPNREFVTIAFAWHALVLFIVWLGCFVLVSLKTRGCSYVAASNTLENIEVETISRNGGDSERSSLIDDEETDHS